VNVNVTGKNDLKLVVLDGGDGIDFDHADWADAHVTAVAGTIAIPPAPLNVTAVTGDRRVTLSWSPSPGADSYNVYRGTSANGEATDPIVGGLTGTSFNDTGLANGTKYYYRIIAVNNSGMSARSLEVSGTPGGNGGGGGTPPPAPAGLTGTGGDKQVTLTWSPSTGATSYALFLGTAANGESPTPVRTGITGTTFTDTGLTNGTKYFFKLAAMNGGSMSPMSNEASATPTGASPLPPPPAPTGLTSKAGDKQIVLTWTAIPTTGATYNIFRGTTSNGEASLPVAGGLTSPMFTSMGLTNGTTYFFKVTASVGGVSSAMSNETSATPAGAPPPPAPTGLTSKAGDKQVGLSWTAIPTAGATYSVFRGLLRMANPTLLSPLASRAPRSPTRA
jgi:fibronectin type 3 domain-containing protein